MKLTFQDGKENQPIIESQDMENSVFSNQYVLAEKIFNALLADAEARKHNNIISFCGDRGTGKTSCMMSFKSKCERDLNDCFFLKEIDPSFFDDTHNIIELVVGSLYSVLSSEAKKDEYADSERNNLVSQFNKVMIYLKYLAKPEDKEHYYDGLQELEALSVGLSLQDSIQKLFATFLEYVNKKYLIIVVDDLDLNIQGAYIMSEHIRKYLTNDRCIIMLSVKVEQLIDAVQHYLENSQNVDSAEGHEMAVKYVTKLIPVSSRVNMPLLEDYCDNELIYTNSNGVDYDEFHSVKEAVTHSIFWKTGYLFYNSRGRNSLIIPSSLRSLRQLLHMLYRMPLRDKEHLAEHKQNQKQFKQYFFYTWTQQLSAEYRHIAHKLISIESDLAFNKAVVANLMTLDVLKNSHQFKFIADPSNYAYNISLGDVMRILEYLDQDESDMQLQLFVFFVRSLYSIKMYECYDFVTEDINNNHYPEPANNEKVGEIYSSDVMFEHTNKMQKLVNGRYFSFEVDEVLPPQSIQGDENQSRDCKLINGDILIAEIQSLGHNKDQIDDSYKERFQMVEFFMLTISRLANIKRKTDSWELKRNAFEPSYLMPFHSTIKNLVFDVLSPFYNVLNLKNTYNRFDVYFNQTDDNLSIYDFAKRHDWSLLSKMITNNDREYDNEMHGFLSDAVLRNAEVLNALSERIRVGRFDSYSSQNKICIKEFYNKITKSGMRTYPKSKEDEPYQIQFKFLNVICSFLESCNHDAFEAIFGRQNEVENIIASLFTARDYAQSTILGTLSKALPQIYQKISRKEWKEKFPDKRNSRAHIIEVIEEVQRR
ncbi:P-loop NTPase fold protein [Alistipes sp. An116]|uniref:P-loop NTPase fold protein n=1 Tax=Alistipes sp. An116 TaxID=1965546 RepID=UPI001177CC90|nr:P-loop NTPase fold protein [Alistipes sp. An116]